MSASLAAHRAPDAIPSPLVYFFSGLSPVARLAFERAASARPESLWRHQVLRTAEQQSEFESASHAPDVIISFLNGYILKSALLDAVQGGAFNVHPSLPEYPGRDPWHFAHYDRFPRAGATLHRMTARVDEGEIIDVCEREFDPDGSVAEYRDLCHELAVALLLANLDALLAGSVEARCTRSWRAGAKKSRRDFLRMCEVDAAMSADEVGRRIRSFNTPDHENVFTVVRGRKFFYRSVGRP